MFKGKLVAIEAIALTIAGMAFPIAEVSGHPGGLAADGCHNDRKNG